MVLARGGPRLFQFAGTVLHLCFTRRSPQIGAVGMPRLAVGTEERKERASYSAWLQ